MSRNFYHRMLILLVIATGLLAFDTSSADAQYYGWWSRGPLRRTVAFVFSPWVGGWRGYYGYGSGYGGCGYGYGGCYGCDPCCGNWHVACDPCVTTVRKPAAPVPPKADMASLLLSVPADSQVLVNGHETTSTGATRTYYSRGLREGEQYKYEIRVLDGDAAEETKTVYLTGGTRSRLNFDGLEEASSVVPVSLTTSPEVETTLRLHVPGDAKVTLGGNPTTIRGETRTYRTTTLAPGEMWENYRIVATVNREGRRLTAEKSIVLSAGEIRDVYLDFTPEQ
ncbi:MAG: TIGR03000 domain-containing protein [Pirellulaceae bacterium]